MHARSFARPLTALALGVTLAACQDAGSPTAPSLDVRPNGYRPVEVGTGIPTTDETLQICKYGSTASIYVELTETNPALTTSNTYTVNDGECWIVADFNSNSTKTFTVRETPIPAGFQLDSIRVKAMDGGVSVFTGTDTWNLTVFGKVSYVVEFFNSRIPVVTPGCTNTIGYWKTHDGSGPQADVVSALLPVTLGNGGGKSVVVTNTTMSHAILNRSWNGGASDNGISKLYSQLLAAKLNIKRGASGAAVASTISAADAFLTSYDNSDWRSLSKAQQNQVNAWMTALDEYNNGVTGPGHCG